MIPDPNPRNLTRVSVRDHESPGRSRPQATPRGTFATPVPRPRQPGSKTTGYSAVDPSMVVGGPSTTIPPGESGAPQMRPYAGKQVGGATRPGHRTRDVNRAPGHLSR